MNSMQFQFADEMIAGALITAIMGVNFPLSSSPPTLGTTLGIQGTWAGSLDNLPAPAFLRTYLNAIYVGYLPTRVSEKPINDVPVVLAGGGSRAVIYAYRLLYFRGLKQATVDAGTGPADIEAHTAVVSDIRRLAALFNGPALNQLRGTVTDTLPGLSVVAVRTPEYGIDQEWSRVYSTMEYQTGVGYIEFEIDTLASFSDPTTW